MSDPRTKGVIEAWERGVREGGAALRSAFLERMDRDGMTYGSRPICSVLRPLFLSRSVHAKLISDADALVSALQILAEERRFDDLLSFEPEERALFEIDHGFSRHDTVGRLDGFIAPDGRARFVEYNAESPGGIAFGDALGKIFDDMPFVPSLHQAFAFERLAAMQGVVDTFIAEWREFARANGREIVEHPRVAIIDFAEMATKREFTLFRDLFEQNGFPTVVADPKELEISGDALLLRGERVDIVYRRLVTSDMLAQPERSEVVVEAVKRRLAFIGPGFCGHRLSNKGWFALLSDPATQPAGLTDEQRSVVAHCLPWTRLMGPDTKPAQRGADDPRPLADIAITEQEQMVLKPVGEYGGTGVMLGWTMTPEAWREAVDVAQQRGGFVLQERVPVPEAVFPGLDGPLKLHWDIAPYVLAGRVVAPAGVRLSGSALLNVTAGGGSAVPLYLVDHD